MQKIRRSDCVATRVARMNSRLPCEDRHSRVCLTFTDKLEARKSKAVVAGHKVPENDDDPRIIGETRQYLRDFDRLNEATANARELYDAMLDLYPDRVNPGSLWGAANTAKKDPANQRR